MLRHASPRTTVTPAIKTLKDRLPNWVEAQGGGDRWTKWVKARAATCHQRARKWKKKANKSLTLPRGSEWTDAIISALNACNGVAVYSGWKLDVTLPATSPLYPSVDHVAGLGTAHIAIETRLVNDMKTILDEAEFKKVIAHLAVVLGVQATLLPDGWTPKRTFCGRQTLDEPPLGEECFR